MLNFRLVFDEFLHLCYLLILRTFFDTEQNVESVINGFSCNALY